MTIKKVAIFGAGAVGSYCIYGLSKCDIQLSVIAKDERNERIKKNINRNDFVVELTYHTKIRKESSLWIHLILHQHKKGHHLIREERYYISIRLNIDHRSGLQNSKRTSSSIQYNQTRGTVQNGVFVCRNGFYM